MTDHCEVTVTQIFWASVLESTEDLYTKKIQNTSLNRHPRIYPCSTWKRQTYVDGTKSRTDNKMWKNLYNVKLQEYVNANLLSELADTDSVR